MKPIVLLAIIIVLVGLPTWSQTLLASGLPLGANLQNPLSGPAESNQEPLGSAKENTSPNSQKDLSAHDPKADLMLEMKDLLSKFPKRSFLAKDAPKKAALLVKPKPQNSELLGLTARSLSGSLDIQTKLPLDEPQKHPRMPSPDFSFLSLILKFGFWVVVGFIVIIVAWTIIQHLKFPRSSEPEKTEDPKPLVQTLDRIYEQSLNLAKKGRFTEAIHELLLKSLEEFQKRQRTSFPSSLTSREILANLKLGPPVEPALAFIVQKTEICFFGLYEPNESDYLDCQTNFKNLLQGLGSWVKK